MKQTKVMGIAVFLVASYTNCFAQQTSLNQLSWLIGRWRNPVPRGMSYEIWERESNTAYKGKSFVLKGTDTVFMEHLQLTQKGNELFYVATVRDQNGGRPVAFKQVPGSVDEHVFENKKHDFPRRIVYMHPAADSAFVYIDGYKNGKYHKSNFPMKRF